MAINRNCARSAARQAGRRTAVTPINTNIHRPRMDGGVSLPVLLQLRVRLVLGSDGWNKRRKRLKAFYSVHVELMSSDFQHHHGRLSLSLSFHLPFSQIGRGRCLGLSLLCPRLDFFHFTQFRVDGRPPSKTNKQTKKQNQKPNMRLQWFSFRFNYIYIGFNDPAWFPSLITLTPGLEKGVLI